MESKCPICSKLFSDEELELHVNSCLDKEEKRRTKRLKTDKRDKKVDKKSDAFKVLGLRMKSTDEKKSQEGKKSGPSLTSLLIAERRLKEKNRKEAEQLAREKGIIIEEPASQTKTKVPERIEIATQVISQPPSKLQETLQLHRESRLPLAQRLRPKSLDDFFGQEKLVGPNGLLRNIIESQEIPSFILWGVPGVGKTSLARIIANSTNYRFVELSGPSANASKMREVFSSAENDRGLSGSRTLVFLDEIHRFNKAQQDLLLPVIEKGIITVIGATTENPSFTLNNALLSRMHTFIMESLSHEALVKILNRGLFLLNQTRRQVHKLHLISLNKECVDYIADLSAGDARVSLNILETINAYLSGTKFQVLEKFEQDQIESQKSLGVVKLTREIIEPLLASRNYQKMYDHHGESHYDTISAFHKSIRGSDPDAAIFYLTKMLVGGEDPLFILRRMIVIASEDIGVRDSSVLPFVVAAKEAFEFIGMPEGEIILAHVAVRLAKSPKSTKSYRALRSAQALFKDQPAATSFKIPMHLRNAPTKLMKEMGYGDTYRYNPDFERGVVLQKYLPEEIKEVKFLDETHLGRTRDPLVKPEDYKRAKEDEQIYLKFKNERKTLKEKSIKDRLQKDVEGEESPEDLEGETSLYPYDEFLSKEDQPDYFDGEEIDLYSQIASQKPDESYDELLAEEEHAYEEYDSNV
ncbi:DNA-dependent ATPase Mgs1p [[Candida] jaroonii]|uniref:DNA-dependent ATPase Mgs1p n=1 Tax=[Candida] jaroonii TaxID=467808 RepID=A0ACA9Y0B1_9ASCO|nr:DNA-dependent ATPase Mgs1p [[Candida] jaroonii]